MLRIEKWWVTRREAIFIWVFIGLVSLLSGSICVKCLFETYQQIQTKHWPTAVATIRSGSIGMMTGKHGNSWYPVWAYDYTIQSVEYRERTDNTINLEELHHQPSPSLAKKELTKYPNGSTVRIRYNPDDPSTSAIEIHETRTADYIFALLFSMFFLGPILFGLVKVRAK